MRITPTEQVLSDLLRQLYAPAKNRPSPEVITNQEGLTRMLELSGLPAHEASAKAKALIESAEPLSPHSPSATEPPQG